MLNFPTEAVEPTPEIESQLSANKMRTPAELFHGMDWRDKINLKGDIWYNYADAMRMRDREPLEEESFEYNFFKGGNYEKTIMFGGVKDGFLLGNDLDGVFVPTHFAPTTLRGGYRLIKELLDEDLPTALFITQDLVDTIQKMDGYKILPFKIKANFRGEEVEKTLVISRWDALPKLAVGQAQRFVKSKLSHIKYKLREPEYYITKFGKKVKDTLRRNNSNTYELDEEMEDLLGDDTMERMGIPQMS